MDDASRAQAPYSDLLNTAIKAVSLVDRSLIGKDGREHMLVPEGYDVRDITDPFRLAGHVRQMVDCHERGALIDYANRFSTEDSVIFADIKRGNISLHADYHKPGGESGATPAERQRALPDQDEHGATWHLEESEAFKAWSEFQGKFAGQIEFAAFLDENACDVVVPSGAELLEIVRDLQTHQDNRFTGKVDLHSGNAELRFETEAKQLQKVHLPREVILNIPIWEGEPPVQIECALRWRAQDGAALLRLDFRRIARVKLEAFRNIANDVGAATGVPVFIGRAV